MFCSIMQHMFRVNTFVHLKYLSHITHKKQGIFTQHHQNHYRHTHNHHDLQDSVSHYPQKTAVKCNSHCSGVHLLAVQCLIYRFNDYIVLYYMQELEYMFIHVCLHCVFVLQFIKYPYEEKLAPYMYVDACTFCVCSFAIV